MCQSLKKPFEGRIDRLTYIAHFLIFLMLMGFVESFNLAQHIGGEAAIAFSSAQETWNGILLQIYKLLKPVWLPLFVLMSFSVAIRRCQDFGMSYKLPTVLLAALFAVSAFWHIPAGVAIMLAILALIPGQKTANQYGERTVVRHMQTYFSKLYAFGQNVQGLKTEEEIIAANLPEERASGFLKNFLLSFEGRVSRKACIIKTIQYTLLSMPVSFIVGALLVSSGAVALLIVTGKNAGEFLDYRQFAFTALVTALVIAIALLLPIFFRLITLTIQRLHDLGFSAKWYALYVAINLPMTLISMFEFGFFSLLGEVISQLLFTASWVVLFFIPGQTGANRFGGDSHLVDYLNRREKLLAKLEEKVGPEEADRVEALLSMPNSKPVEEEKTEELPKPAPKKKAAAKKAPAKKSVAKKTPTKKATASKAKPAAKKASASKAKAPVKKTAAKKAPAKKPAAKKTTASKKKES